MTEAVAEHGYANTAVADVLARSGVSRATFYQLFSDKEDCFGAAFAANADLVAQVMEDGVRELESSGTTDPISKLDHVLRFYLDVLRGAPAWAKVFLVDVYAAGPKAIEKRRESIERFVGVVVAVLGGSGILGPADEQRFAAEVLVGAVSSMVTNMVGTGDFESLSSLREPLIALARRVSGSSDRRSPTLGTPAPASR
jgi:AcrR family transcriptional regulator